MTNNEQFFDDFNESAKDLKDLIENFYYTLDEQSANARPWEELWTLPAYDIDRDSAELAKSLSKWIKLRSRKR